VFDRSELPLLSGKERCHVIKCYVRVIALAGSLALAAAACGGTTGRAPSPTQRGKIQKGGDFHIGLASDFHQGVDPQREYYTIGWEWLKCCLTRQLVGFNLLGPNEKGNDLVPDLATELPTASSDGLTWTFHIKPNIHYAPPLQNVSATAGDFIRALTRVAVPETAAQYPFYYSVIQGFDDVVNGKAKSISGLSAPDPQTLQVKLSQAVGYFPYLFTLPAVSPIPPSPTDPNAPLGVAQGHKQNYAPFVASTGPYMYKGADGIDYTQPADQQKTPEGYQAGKSYVLVRNPSWDPSTDPNRKAYVDEIDATVGGTTDDLQNKIEAAELDTLDALPNPKGIRDYVVSAALKPFIHSDPTFGTYYINMNLAMPPFDDIHVRKAMNWAVDKAGVQRLAGGAILGDIATHIIPNSMLPGLKDYVPYGNPDGSPDAAKAKAEMAQSKYDTNKDGVCDADACKNVLMVIDQTDPNPKMAALMQQNIQEIGITVNIKQFQTTTMYTKCEDATQRVPTCPSEGWYADFADPYAFVTGLFSSVSLTPSCCNDSNMGATAEQVKKWGYPITGGTMGADTQLNQCISVLGDARQSCYEGVDKYLMEQVVPWVPYRFANQVTLTSNRTLNFHTDASTGWISLAQIALRNGGK
jgi:peptide/nickel transport system substrate-binding protein